MRLMRSLGILFFTIGLAACSAAPPTRGVSRAVDPANRAAAELQSAKVDSVVQFLLTAAATDFHTHRPPDPVRFRDVRVGHSVNPSGRELYMLCGQFMPAPERGSAEWTPFVTIKTSGYEQYLGPQAAGFCRDSSVKWNEVGDLSLWLKSRLDSLRRT